MPIKIIGGASCEKDGCRHFHNCLATQSEEGQVFIPELFTAAAFFAVTGKSDRIAIKCKSFEEK